MRVYNAAGASSDDVRVALPSSRWSAVGRRRLRGYRYRAAPGSGEAVRQVRVTPDAIFVDVRGLTWGYILDEAARNRVGVVLRLGDTRYCAESPAGTRKPTTDRRGEFVGTAGARPPAHCPP